MKIKTILYMLLLFLISSNSSFAAYFMESLIYTGPPEYDESYEYSESSPTSVSWNSYGKDMESHSGWWSVGGRLDNRWDSTHQGWSNIYADMEKEFQITEAGAASITFSFDGLLQVNGSTNHDGDYYSYAQAEISDYTRQENADVEWFHIIEEVGSLNISETTTFNYLFDADDVGNNFSIWMWFDSEIGLPLFADDLVLSDDEWLEFHSNLVDALKIVNITGGIETADSGGPLQTVPIPTALWLFGSGLLGLIGYTKRSRSS